MHFKFLSTLCLLIVLYILYLWRSHHVTKVLPFARLAWCCPLIQSRWPTARWGSKRSLRSLPCVLHGWTREKQSTRDHYSTLHSIKNTYTQYFFVVVPTDQQLRRAILSILRRLFLSDLTEVPDVEPPVGAAGGQDGFVVRRPLDLFGRDGPDVTFLRLSAPQT